MEFFLIFKIDPILDWRCPAIFKKIGDLGEYIVAVVS